MRYNRGINLSETALCVSPLCAAPKPIRKGKFPMICDDSTPASDVDQRQISADLRNKRARNAEPYYWNDEIELATGRAFNWLCPFCAVDLHQTGYHKAHISPVGSEIGVVPGNIVLSCPDCNRDMHSRHAMTYCQQKGLVFSQIAFTLEILARIFPIEKSNPPDRYTKKPNARSLAEEWFDAYTGDVNAIDAEAVYKHLGIGKSTFYDVWKARKAQGAQRGGE